MDQQTLLFGPFRLEGPHGPLYVDDTELRLPPKALATLWLLAGQAGQVVTKSAILDSVWNDAVVGQDALGFQIRLLRHALADDARNPRYIQTMHRVGYRFVASVRAVPSSRGGAAPPPERPSSSSDPLALAGRERELALLDQLYRSTLEGRRQLVFISGEAGIGKTALIDAALASAVADPGAHGRPRIARGQCVEQYGAGEAYRPVLEALNRLFAEIDRQWLIGVLQRHAPSWLLQLPALAEAADADRSAWQARAGGRERMLREIADALEVISAEHPLILVLEDLHWADPSTVELLALVGRRTEHAHLLIAGTYRSPDLVAAGHPLHRVKQELAAQQRSVEMPLGLLDVEAVRDYLRHRLGETTVDGALVDSIYRRTDGHPFFLVQITADLARGALPRPAAGSTEGAAPAWEVAREVPHGIREMIEARLGRLSSAHQRLLEAASVAGVEFDVPAVAAAINAAVDDVEASCQELARHRQFIADQGLVRWPDGTLSGRYRFHHGLIQEVLYSRLGAGHLARLHLAVGERKARGWGDRAGEIAAELAVHFDRGLDVSQAANYYWQAGTGALRQHAYLEALASADAGLAALDREPETAGRVRHELRLQTIRGAALLAYRGFSAHDVHQAYTRARLLSQQIDDPPTLVPVLYGLWNFHLTRGDLQQARVFADRLLGMTPAISDPALAVQALGAAGWSALFMGEPAPARTFFERGVEMYDVRMHAGIISAYGEDGGLVCHQGAALANWLVGDYARAQQVVERGRRLAAQLEYPFGTAQMLWVEALVAQQSGRRAYVRDLTEVLIALCEEGGFPLWLVGGSILQGWARADGGQVVSGAAQIRRGLNDWDMAGTELTFPFCLGLLADIALTAGDSDEGLAAVDQALSVVERTEERWYEAELNRLKGELCRLLPPTRRMTDDPEALFETALDIARRQQARSFELRAALSLARLWEARGSRGDAQRILAETVRLFDGSQSTADLSAAIALLSAWT